MEKRYERRRLLRMRVAVHDRHGHNGTFETRNTTSQGMYIETGRWALAAGEVIWIDGAEVPSHSLPNPLSGVVVHQGRDGVGVLLSQPLPDIFAAAAPSRETLARTSPRGDPRARIKAPPR